MAISTPVLGAVSYEPIKAVRISGAGSAVPASRRVAEVAALTSKQGVPLTLSAGGYLAEVDFTTNPDVVFGVSQEPGHNLAASGTSSGGLSEGTPPNQPAAAIIPVGAHLKLGDIGVYIADGQNVFSIALKTGQVFTQNLLLNGTYYGLTKDATSGFYYLDVTDVGGDNAVALLLGVDDSSPNDGVNGTRVFFQFKASQRYFA